MTADPLDDLLERGLSSAFDRGDPSSIHGVLLEASREEVVPEKVGRFKVRSLVGRGGMGLVLRSEDPQLGRPLAIKVMRAAATKDPGLIERFVAEARVCSQLQHPGVVPVHEMGRTEGDVPFFTMRLVEGETLEELLAGTPPGDEGQARLLDVFERLCQTVAYAHTKGVVHRDLKPANVMVGAFGEVQLMDWGLASLRDGSGKAQTEAIVGTPGYMAPEQARGEAGWEPRSDVFALGAILCEILTGAPPYRGELRSELILAAAKGWLDEAVARLRSCDADVELVELACASLERDVDRRPADGGAVLRQLRAYLDSRAAKARALELEAAEASARARAESRSRRLVLALSGAAILSILVAAALRIDHLVERQSRAEALEARVAGLLDEARLLGEEAARHPFQGGVWDRALSAARSAQRVAEESEVRAESRARARFWVDELQGEREQTERDLAMQERLLRIRPHIGENRDHRKQAANYAKLFADYGLDFAKGDPEALMVAIRSSRIASDLRAGLDDWLTLEASNGGEVRLVRLLRRVADACEPNPWLIALRQASLARDAKELERLSRTAEVAKASASSLNLLAKRLDALGLLDDGIRIAGDAVWRFPRDFSLAHTYACLQREKGSAALPAAIRYFNVANTLRGDSVHVLTDLAHAFVANGDLDDAERCLERAEKVDPEYSFVWHYRGIVHELRKEYDEAIRCLEHAHELDPEVAVTLARLALVHYKKRNIAESQRRVQQALTLDPRAANCWELLTATLSLQGRTLAARAAAEQLVKVAPKSASAHYQYAQTLQYSGVSAKALAHYDRALELQPELAEALCNRGMLLLEAGRIPEAVASLRRGHSIGAARPGWSVASRDWVAYARQVADAAELLDEYADEFRADGFDSLDPRERIPMAEAAVYRGEMDLALELLESLCGPKVKAPVVRTRLYFLGVWAAAARMKQAPKEEERCRRLALEFMRGQEQNWSALPEDDPEKAARVQALSWMGRAELEVFRRSDAGPEWAAFWKRCAARCEGM